MREFKVLVVGDKGVGKSSLINKFVSGGKAYNSDEEQITDKQCRSRICHVEDPVSTLGDEDDKLVKFLVSSCSSPGQLEDDKSLRSVNFVLVCFSLSDKTSLTRASTNWVPSLKSWTSHILLVGCHGVTSHLPRVSRDLAVHVASQCGAMTYVETSDNIDSLFITAAMTVLSKTNRKRDRSEQRLSTRQCLHNSGVYSRQSSLVNSVGSLASKSSTLSSTGSTVDIGSTTTTKGMVTIKCGRLTADKTYEEIDIEIPTSVYKNIHKGSVELDCGQRNSRERKSFGSRLKSLLLKS